MQQWVCLVAAVACAFFAQIWLTTYRNAGLDVQTVASEHGLAVIDIAHLAGHQGPTLRSKALASLVQAARDVGVARLVNHKAAVGVARKAGHDYFALPMHMKACAGCSIRNASVGFQRGYIPFAAESGLAEFLEVKEGFSYGFEWPPDRESTHPYQAANVWPPADASKLLGNSWHEAMMGFFNESVGVAMGIVAALAESLGSGGKDLTALTEGGDTISQMRLFHYLPPPAISEKTCLGSSPHTDWHVVTIIARDAESMLQYKDQWTGRWVNASLGAPDELILLVGDWLSAYSGSAFHSAAHRVLLPEQTSSLAFVLFLYPSPGARLPAAHRPANTMAATVGQQKEGLNTVEPDFFDLPWGEYVVRKWAKVMSNR